MRPNARASVVASSKEASAHLVGKCTLIGPRKGLFAKSSFRHEIAIERGFANPTGGYFCFMAKSDIARRVGNPSKTMESSLGTCRRWGSYEPSGKSRITRRVTAAEQARDAEKEARDQQPDPER